MLADGTPLERQLLYIQNGTGASFELLPVPEPGGLALWLMVGALLRHRPARGRQVDGQ